MDFNDEVARVLQNLESNSRDFNKQSLEVLKNLAKEVGKLSSTDRNKAASSGLSESRLRHEMRAKTKKDDQEREKSSKTLTDSLKKTAAGISGMSGLLTLSTDSLVDFVGSLKAIPVVSTLLAGAFTSLIINGIQETLDSFRTLNQSGIVLGKSIFDVNVAATKAGMGIKEFTDLLAKNALSVNKFGIDSIMELNQSLHETNSQMRQMGLTTRDITETLFDYLNVRRRSGLDEHMDKERERQAADEFAATVEHMSLMTGKSFEELRKALVDNISGPKFGLALSLIPEAATEVGFLATALKQYVPNIEEMLGSLVTGTGSGLQDLSMLAAVAPETAQAFTEVTKGNMDAAEAMEILRREVGGFTDEQKRSFSAMAQSGSPLGDIAGNLLLASKDLNEVTQATIDANRATQENTNAFNTAIQDIRETLLLPIFESLTQLEKEDMDAFVLGVKDAAAYLTDLVRKLWNTNNITTVLNTTFSTIVDTGKFVVEKFNEVKEAAENIADFLKIAFSPSGIVGLALSVAFGPRLFELLAKEMVDPEMGGNAGRGGKGGVFRAIGKAAGSGMLINNLLNLGLDVINNDIDKGTAGNIGGMLTGAGLGFAVGGPLGALIGSGIGGIAGQLLGFYLEEQTPESLRNYWQNTADANNAMIEALTSKITELEALGDAANTTEIELLNKRLDIAKSQQTAAQEQLDAVTAAETQIATANENIAEIKRQAQLGLISPSDAAADITTQEGLASSGQAAIDDSANAKQANQQRIDEYNALMSNMGIEGITNIAMGMRAAGYNQGQIELYSSILSNSNISDLSEIVGAKNILTELSGKGVSAATDMLQTLAENTFAAGGITTTPGIFGEAGAEAAIPLDSGLRIPIAEVKGISELQNKMDDLAMNNAGIRDALAGVKNSIDKLMAWHISSDKSGQSLEALVGIYEKLDDISDTNSSMNRSIRSNMGF